MNVRSVEIHDRKLEERKEVSKIRKLTTNQMNQCQLRLAEELGLIKK